MKITRYFAAALAAVTVLTPVLASCGKVKMPDKQTVDHVYRTTEIAMPDGLDYIDSLTVLGDKICFMGNIYNEEDYSYTTRMYEMNLDGTNLTDVTPPEEEKEEGEEVLTDSGSYTFATANAPDGTSWKAENYYFYNSETGRYTDGFRFVHTAADGSEIAVFDGTDLWGEVPEGEYHGLNGFTVAEDGTIVAASNETIYLTDETFAAPREVDITSYAETGYIQNFFSEGETLYMLHYDWSGSRAVQSLIPLDVKTGALGEKIMLDPEVIGEIYSVFPGEGYTFYYMNETAVYGYDVATGTATELLNFLNSDLNYSIAYNMQVVSADKFIAHGYDSLTRSQGIYILDRVPDDQVVPKYIITLGVLEDDWSVLSDVIRFNRQSDEYRITIKTYELNYDDEGEYDYDALIEEAVTALGNDILTGNGPDILVTSPYLPMESYVAKKLFVNMYDFIDEDERFSREEFLANVLSAMEIRGGLYEISPTFYLQTLVGKTSVVGDRDRWTMEEFAAWAKSLPETTVPFFETTRESMMDLFLSAMYTEFVDTDTGTCSFDSEAFKELLSFLATLPEELDEDRYNDEDYWNKYDNRFREDYAALQQLSVTRFSSLMSYMSYPFYSNELSMVGIPTSGESGAVISAGNASFAISAKTPLKDGAWAFVSYFLTKEYQDTIRSYFPLRMDSLTAMMEQQLADAEEERKYYEEHKNDYYYGFDDNFGVAMPVVTTASEETVSADTESAESDAAEESADTDTPADTESAVDTEIETPDIKPEWNPNEPLFLTREMAEQILAYIKSANRMARRNASVTNIIKEDAAAFFAGQKPLDETVKLIQNRVWTFVSESQ